MTMSNVNIRIAFGIVLMAFGTLTHAGHRYGQPGLQGEDFYDQGEVIHIKPVIRAVEIASPREVCWNEELPRYDPSRDAAMTYTPVILGGIVGGIVGNQFGRGKGKDVLTIAGALLGGSVGYEASRRSPPATSGLTTVRRCETETEYHMQERVEGYHVTYRYQGRTFAKRLNQPPGDRIRLRVWVQPVDY